MHKHSTKQSLSLHNNHPRIVIALAAQPNVGKTTLFNTLTSSRGYVANWPGKTVERMEGEIFYKGYYVKIIDLPGIRSLSAISQEEKIARDFILSNDYDSLIILVDSETLEKTLYFAVQILEVTNKAVVAINKYDEAHSLGLHINQEKLQSILGVPVVPISALKKYNINLLLEKALEIATLRQERKPAVYINYGILEGYIEDISKKLEEIGYDKSYSRIITIRLLEGDTSLLLGLESKKEKEIMERIDKIKIEVREKTGFTCEELIIMSRYKFVEQLVKETSVKVKVATRKFVEALDRLFLRNYLVGLLLSLSILFLILFVSFTINTGFPLNVILKETGNEELAELIESYSIGGLLSSFFSYFSSLLENLLQTIKAPEPIIDLTVNGIVSGVGAVLTFFPIILVVNVAMAIVEDSGIMARIAVVFHRLFSRFNLSGKAAFPLTISWACNVPGVLATRILEDERERFGAAITIPFIICQARLVVLLFFVSALFVSPIVQSSVAIFLYLLSIVTFLLIYNIVSKVLFKRKESSELFIEMPSYHIPSLRVVSWISWERSKSFITKAGTIILPMAIVIWAILHIGPSGYVTTPDKSFGRFFGELVSSAFYPIGISRWEIGLALLTGFIAKELVVETLAVAFNSPDPRAALEALSLSPASSLSLLVFIMLYTPCLATVVTVYTETRSLKMTLVSIVTSLLVAYILSLITFFFFSLLNFV